MESTINQVISKRLVKKQSMRWTDRGASLLLQVRTKTLNDERQTTFERWYPGMTKAACLRFVMGSSPISWQHINLLGEYGFSDKRLEDSMGILPAMRLTEKEGAFTKILNV